MRMPPPHPCPQPLPVLARLQWLCSVTLLQDICLLTSVFNGVLQLKDNLYPSIKAIMDYKKFNRVMIMESHQSLPPSENGWSLVWLLI